MSVSSRARRGQYTSASAFALLALVAWHVSSANAASDENFYRTRAVEKTRRAYTPFLGAVTLSLYDDQYVYVIIGNPGRYLKLRLNFQIDYSIMYTDLGRSSQTYALDDSVRTLGSDIFYLGSYKLRLPVVNDASYATNRDLSPVHSGADADGASPFTDVDRLIDNLASARRQTDEHYSDYVTNLLSEFADSTRSDNPPVFANTDPDLRYVTEALEEHTQINGELALGPGSLLWKYWKNFTISVDSISLGAYDPYVQHNHRYRGPVVPILFYYPLWTPKTTFSPYTSNEQEGSVASDVDTSSQSTLFARILEYQRAKMERDESLMPVERQRKLQVINRLLLHEQSVLQPRQHVPRGSFVVLGEIDGSLYKIILNFQSYSTYVPRHLKQRTGFSILFHNIKSLLERLGDPNTELEAESRRRDGDLYDIFVRDLLVESYDASASSDQFLRFHDDDRGLGFYDGHDQDDKNLTHERIGAPTNNKKSARDDNDDGSGVFGASALSSSQSVTLAEFLREDTDRRLNASTRRVSPGFRASVHTCIDGYLRLGIDAERFSTLSAAERRTRSSSPRYCSNATSLYFSLADHQIVLKNDFRYNTVFESPIRDVIILGKYSLRHLALFIDLKELKMVISPSYHFFIQSSTNFYLCLTSISLLCTNWLLTANAGTIRNFKYESLSLANVVQALAAFQMFSGMFFIVSCILLVSGYEVHRFLYHYSRTSLAPWIIAVLCFFVGTFSAINIALSAITVLRVAHHQRLGYTQRRASSTRFASDTQHWSSARMLDACSDKPIALVAADADARQYDEDDDDDGQTHLNPLFMATINAGCNDETTRKWYRLDFIVDRYFSSAPLRRFMHETSAVVVAWLCLLQQHQTLIDALFLTLVAQVATMNATFCAFDSVHRRVSISGFMFLVTMLVYIFFYAFNVLPVVELIWGPQNPFRHVISLMHCTLFTYAPSVYLYSMYQRKRLTNKAYKKDILLPSFKQD